MLFTTITKGHEVKSLFIYSFLCVLCVSARVCFKFTFLPHFLGYDSLFIGGASEASVLEREKYPFLANGEALIHYCLTKEIPVFASCFGFQLDLALGGNLLRDEVDFEMGTIPIRLTQAARQDPIFEDIDNEFLAIAVHRERALELPGECEVLAYTDQCLHAFRVRDKPFWAFQFHPEVDKQRLVERLTIYRAKYTDGDDHLNKIIAEASETPEANRLLNIFVERILLKGNEATPGA